MRTMPLPRGKTLYSPRFLAALEVAAVMFATTRRKKTRIPYVAHLLGVCAIVLEHGGTEDEAIAALLHDTLEDITPTKQARRTVRAFGDDVYGIVEGCTQQTPDREGKKAPWRERREAYVAALGHEPRSVLLVSAADKLNNARAIVADLRPIGDRVWKRFNAPKDDILWYYGALVEAFRANPAHDVALVDELDRTVQASSGVRPRTGASADVWPDARPSRRAPQGPSAVFYRA
jgi:(p)ppGpp synthase/HD superfamily hydrolase